MKNSMKRFFCIAMAAAMVIVMAAACGSKKEDSAEPEETKTEVSEEQSEEPDIQEEEAETKEPDVKEGQEENAEMTEEQKAVQDEKEEFLRAIKERGEEIDEDFDPVDMLHASDEQLQELFDAVKADVTEKYLVKYDIEPKDFVWPDNISGKGEPKPWGYLSERIAQKVNQLVGGNRDSSNIEPETFYIDQQTAELMDCLYEDIANWSESVSLDPLMMAATMWNEVIIPNVTFE